MTLLVARSAKPHDLGKEPPRQGLTRVPEDLRRRAAFKDFSARNESNLVGHRAGKPHFVGAQNDVLTRRGEFLNKFEHLSGHLGIQRGGGLIKQKNLRTRGDGSGQSGALLLTA